MSLLSLGLPGGNQVDGLPPAASTKYSCPETRGRSELFVNLGRFFEKILIFLPLASIFEILYILNMLLLMCMQEGLLGYEVLDRR